MSAFICPIVRITLKNHPEADFLSVASVEGMDYTVVVRTEDFINEDLAVYLPLDAIAPKEHKLLGFLEG